MELGLSVQRATARGDSPIQVWLLLVFGAVCALLRQTTSPGEGVEPFESGAATGGLADELDRFPYATRRAVRAST